MIAMYETKSQTESERKKEDGSEASVSRAAFESFVSIGVARWPWSFDVYALTVMCVNRMLDRQQRFQVSKSFRVAEIHQINN